MELEWGRNQINEMTFRSSKPVASVTLLHRSKYIQFLRCPLRQTANSHRTCYQHTKGLQGQASNSDIPPRNPCQTFC